MCVSTLLPLCVCVCVLLPVCVCVSVSPQEEVSGAGLKDQKVLGVKGYAQLFSRSVETLRTQLADQGDGAELVWDKVTRTQGPVSILHTSILPSFEGASYLTHLGGNMSTLLGCLKEAPQDSV